jgi:DNA-binding transcriptional LysR family regulator
VAVRIVAELDAAGSGLSVRFDEEVTPELLRRIASHELAAGVVMASPAAPRYHGVRIDTLRDEPLLAALSASHEYANAAAIPVAAFVAEVVMLPREPVGQMFNSWFRSLIRSVGFEVDRTLETISAPWDRRVLPVANGEAVCPFVAEWAVEAPGVVAVPFDPPLSFPVDFASCWPATEAVEALVEAALRVRDAEGWLTQRSARTELPTN